MANTQLLLRVRVGHSFVHLTQNALWLSNPHLRAPLALPPHLCSVSSAAFLNISATARGIMPMAEGCVLLSV